MKTGHIKDNTTAPGLQEAKQKLQVMKMNKAERQAYDRHIDNIMVQNDVLDTAKLEGIEEGHAEGRAEKKRSLAKAMKAEGLPPAIIAKISGLSVTTQSYDSSDFRDEKCLGEAHSL